MQANKATVSASFKSMTIKAIMAIVLFIITYLVLIVLAAGLAALCGYFGLQIIIFRPGTLTILLGGGLAGMGILIFIFLIKFIFATRKMDMSHLIEVKRDDEPRLFEMIGEIVQQVETTFPKKVYLSSNVNASVFYNSSFWSMFLPVRKNLEIGVGLVNTVSETEFKAILAHEFGHFSQRSMKVGSYVYNVNQVLHNMLFNNSGYASLAEGFANVHGFFAFFTQIAVGIINGIQWILGKVYNVINLTYLGLSREMEFHADEVAAHVAGSKAMSSALMRIELADHSFNTVVEHYSKKIPDSVKTSNIYPQQKFVMNLIAAENKLPLVNELPQVTTDFQDKYNKSKLVIKDQWASHPTTSERVAALKKLSIVEMQSSDAPASAVFADIDATQRTISDKLFSGVSYASTPVDETLENFEKSYRSNYLSVSFNDVFNSYYDNKNPVLKPAASASQLNRSIPVNELFDEEAVNMVYTSISIESDLAAIKNISSGVYPIKTFDYDGVKYKSKNCAALIEKLESDLSVLKQKIEEHDALIFDQFNVLAEKKGKAEAFNKSVNEFQAMEKDHEEKTALYNSLAEKVAFFNQSSTLEEINTNLQVLEVLEKDFKKHLEEIQAGEKYQEAITDDSRQVFSKYLELSTPYFNGHAYDNEALQVLFGAINNLHGFLQKHYVNTKRRLLDFEAKMLVEDAVPVA